VQAEALVAVRLALRAVDAARVVAAPVVVAVNRQPQPQHLILLRTHYSLAVVTAFIRSFRVRLMTPCGVSLKPSRGISFG